MPRWTGVAAPLEMQQAYEPLRGFDAELALGVGHVRPAREEDRDDWLRRLGLPIFESPGGRFGSWLTGASEAALETGYETTSFIVHEERDDGWLRIRYAKSGSVPHGWVHRCHLQASTPRLQYEPWERLFSSDAVSPFFFRSRVRHALRVAASLSAAAITWLPADPREYAIEPLEFAGDWAKVRVKLPSDYCVHPPVKPAVHEGWIQWRSAERGPWVWYYTRGC